MENNEMKIKNNRLLVIDDDEIVLRAYRGFLSHGMQQSSTLESMVLGTNSTTKKEADYHLDLATQGEDGYAMVMQAQENDNPYAIVFIDMIMPPGWDGLQTAKAIRKLDDQIFIVFVTARAEKSFSELQECLGNNILLINKPFSRDEILQLVITLTDFWACKAELNELKKTC